MAGTRGGAPKGQAHRKRGDGSWTTTPSGLRRWAVMVGYKPDGKGARRPDVRYYYGRTEAECRQKHADWLEDQREGHTVAAASERLTMTAWFPAWMKRRRISPATREQHERYIANDLIPALGHLRLRPLGRHDGGALTVEAIEAVLAENADRPRKALELYRILYGALKRARKLRLVGENVVELVDPPDYEAREMHPPTREEVVRLLGALAPADRRLARILAVSQARPSEAIGLEWSDVKWRQGGIAIERTRATRGEPDEQATKTRRSRRFVHLSDEDMELLREHRREQLARIAKLGDRWADHGLVFPDGHGRPLRWSDFWKRWKKARDAAKLPGVRPYDLRHFGLTELAMANVPIEDISRRAGHANVRITDAIYLHPRPTKDRAAAEAIRGLLDGPADAQDDGPDERARQ